MKRTIPRRMLAHSRTLRRNATNAEALLWSCLRSGQLAGFKFRRQHPIGHFILDFYCHKGKLSIELDGSQHATLEQADYDESRTLQLNSRGIRVLRFWDNEVFENLEGVLQVIFEALTSTLSRNGRGSAPPP
jgi:very-short-patch-repair endonuclease